MSPDTRPLVQRFSIEAGVQALALMGSTARGEATDLSDIDFQARALAFKWDGRLQSAADEYACGMLAGLAEEVWPRPMTAAS